MGQLRTLSLLLGLTTSLAAATNYNDFIHSYGKLRSQLLNPRESRDVGYQGKVYKDENWVRVLPAIPETLENVPISCENDDRNYCNYPDLVPFESTNIHEISKFPIPSGRCPDGYSRVPTYDCLNFAPALFETTCCVYNTPPPTPVQMCPIDPANVVINAAAKLCDDRLLLVTYLRQESQQLVWALDSKNLSLTRATPYRLEDVTANCFQGDQYQVLAAMPGVDCTIEWIARALATDIIKVCKVQYLDKITAGMRLPITDQQAGYSGVVAGTGDGQLTGKVIKGVAADMSDTNTVISAFGLGERWAYVSFLIASEGGRPGCDAFARINNWLFNENATSMPAFKRVKLAPMMMGGGASATTQAPVSSSRAYANEPTAASSGAGSNSAAASSNNALQAAILSCNVKGMYYNSASDNIVVITASGQVNNYMRNGKLSSDPSNRLDLNAIVCNVVKPTPNATDDNTMIMYIPIPYQYPPPGANGNNAYGSGGSSSSSGGGNAYGAPQTYQTYSSPASSSRATTQAPYQTSSSRSVYGQQSSGSGNNNGGGSSSSGGKVYGQSRPSSRRNSFESGVNSDNGNNIEDDQQSSSYLDARKTQPYRYQRQMQ